MFKCQRIAFSRSQIERLEDERLKLKQNCRQLARQAGVKAAENGLRGDSVWTDDQGIVRAAPSSTSGAIDFARGEYDQQLKAGESKIDQLSRDLFEKTNENRMLITTIRDLEQGMKEIDQQLKQRRSQKGDSQAPLIIQCPTLEKMLQVNQSESLVSE